MYKFVNGNYKLVCSVNRESSLPPVKMMTCKIKVREITQNVIKVMQVLKKHFLLFSNDIYIYFSFVVLIRTLLYDG